MAQDKEYSVTYHPRVYDELAKLDFFWQDEILFAVEGKLMARPAFFGKPLRRTLKGCWALRVGDYRIVYRIEAKTIRILAVIHRSSDYKGVGKRI